MRRNGLACFASERLTQLAEPSVSLPLPVVLTTAVWHTSKMVPRLGWVKTPIVTWALVGGTGIEVGRRPNNRLKLSARGRSVADWVAAHARRSLARSLG